MLGMARRFFYFVEITGLSWAREKWFNDRLFTHQPIAGWCGYNTNGARLTMAIVALRFGGSPNLHMLVKRESRLTLSSKLKSKATYYRNCPSLDFNLRMANF